MKKPLLEVREFKLPPSTGVKDYEPPKITDPQSAVYKDVRLRLGPLAATDAERVSPSQKDSRFQLNPETRERLYIEAEERRVIEERVRSRVEAFREEVQARAQAEGFEQGRKSGHDAAYQEFKASAQEQLDRINSFLKGSEAASLTLLEAHESLVVELVHQVASMLALKEIKTDPGYVARLAKGVLEKLGVRENIVVRVNRDEYEALKLLKDDLERDLGTLKNLSVVPSDQVALGGCQVETDLSSVDASIATQLENVRAALLGSQA